MSFDRLAYRDREYTNHFADLEDKSTKRVGMGWGYDKGLTLLSDSLYKDNVRYATESEDENFGYIKYFDANDNFVSGLRIYKNEKKVEIFYPYLLLEDGDNLLTEDSEALVL